MQAYSTEAIRNVALLGHSGSGKTALVETTLFASGGIGRVGKIEDGNTASDFEPEEVERRSSIQTALVAYEWKGKKINLLDTPGYADFIGEVISALAAADLGLITVSGADGVEVGTETAWQQCESRGIPRAVVITKLDRDNTNFYETLESVRDRLGKRCLAIQLPKGAPMEGVISIMDPGAEREDGRFAEFREKLVEAAAESDDALTEKYLEEGNLTPDEIVNGLKAGILAGTVVPVLATSSAEQRGIVEALDFIVDYGPSPDERPVQTEAVGEINAELSAPLAVRVFKTTADPYVGKLSYLRVMGGELKGDSQVWNGNKGQNERIGQLFAMKGKAQDNVPALPPGDLGAVAKLQHTATGDTLSASKEKAVVLKGIDFAKPVHSVALEPKTKSDMDKMGASVMRLVEEDPSLQFDRDQETGETVLSGLGDAHIDVACKKLKRKFGVEVLVSTPAIPFRETIAVKTNSEYKHKKQTGGHGQYGHVHLELEPLPRGSGVEFVARVVGGSVPKEYIPAVEKGVMESIQHGMVPGSKVVDVKVTLIDGSSHPVDSSGMAFQIAAAQAFKKGMQQGSPTLLEPVMSVKVRVPDAYTGDVMGDLNGKRARVSGTSPEEGFVVIEATAPLSEMQRYATDLRSISQGRGSYTMDFSHYDEVPVHLSQKILDEAKGGEG